MCSSHCLPFFTRNRFLDEFWFDALLGPLGKHTARVGGFVSHWPCTGSGAFLTPGYGNRDVFRWKIFNRCWSGSGILDPGSGINIPDLQPGTPQFMYCNHSRTVFSKFLNQQFDTVLHKLITVTQIILNNFFPWKFPSHTIYCVFFCLSPISG